MECPNCRMHLPERAKFCSQCGSALALNCPACGNSEAPGAKFCTECGATFHLVSRDPRSLELASGLLPSPPFTERCHLTVMFCDLVGSTAPSVHLDVEDFHEVIATYQKR